ncbi:unnamed protein product, partial [Didymodactylos carnosus]
GKKSEKLEQNLSSQTSAISSSSISIPSLNDFSQNNNEVETHFRSGYISNDDHVSLKHSSHDSSENRHKKASHHVQNGSTQFDSEMKIKCIELMKSKNVTLLNDVRDFDAKEALLRQAVEINTMSVTVPVIIFLENTLSRSLFFELINQHPSAINHYINMCKLRLEKEYFIAMLKQLGKHEDAAMLQIRRASQTSEIQTKQSRSYGRIQVENRSLLHTFKTVYNSDFPKSDKNESKELETNFKISPELSMYVKLSVIAENGIATHYQEFVTTAIQPGILKQKHVISPHILADMVYSASRDSGESSEQASDRAKRFLTMIVDPEKRVFYAEKFGNYEVAIDTIVNHLKDRTKLENLRKRMPKDHPAIMKATTFLEMPKWKS